MFMTTPAAGYKIGKASQLTGISTDKLRIWERRYAVVVLGEGVDAL
jgi:hypothetical protein